jgi:hypothetical protein
MTPDLLVRCAITLLCPSSPLFVPSSPSRASTVKPPMNLTGNEQRVVVDVDPVPGEPSGQIWSLRENVVSLHALWSQWALTGEDGSRVVVPADDENGFSGGVWVSPPSAKPPSPSECPVPSRGLDFTGTGFAGNDEILAAKQRASLWAAEQVQGGGVVAHRVERCFGGTARRALRRSSGCTGRQEHAQERGSDPRNAAHGEASSIALCRAWHVHVTRVPCAARYLAPFHHSSR